MAGTALRKGVTGAVLVGDKALLRHLRDFEITNTRGVSDAIQKQAGKLAAGIRMHPFVRGHSGLDRSVQTGRYKKRGTFIGSFVRVDYDVATENVIGDWQGKRWLPLVWEYGNQNQTGQRFVVTNTWLRLKKRLLRNLEVDLKKAVIARSDYINKRVANEVAQGLRG
jgi:hypothetical protein